MSGQEKKKEWVEIQRMWNMKCIVMYVYFRRRSNFKFYWCKFLLYIVGIMFGHKRWFKVHLFIPALARLADIIYPWSNERVNWRVSVCPTSFACINASDQLNLWNLLTCVVIIQDADATSGDVLSPGQVFNTVTYKRHLNPYLRKLERFSVLWRIFNGK